MDITGQVTRLLCSQLGPAYANERFDRDSPLLGAVPEFDSMAVVGILTAIEEHFGVSIADDEVSADHFMTVGTLVDFVEGKLAA
jgi:acyl carrier protein